MTDYNPNIPQPTDNLSTSQGQILNNFSQLNSIFDFDHYTWNDMTQSSSAFRGLHRKVDFPLTTTVSAPSGAASVVYAKDVSGVSSLFFDNASGSTTIWRGGSGNGLASYSMNNGLGNGSFTFPNGIIMQWGYAANATDGGTINFNSPFPNNCGHVQVCIQRNSTSSRILYVQTFTTSGVTVRTDAGTVGVLWFAIGN